MTASDLKKIIRDVEKCSNELTEDQWALLIYVKEARGTPREDLVDLLVELHERFYP